MSANKEEGTIRSIGGPEVPAQATGLVGVLAHALAQKYPRVDVGLGDHLLAAKHIGHHHSDFTLPGHNREVADGEWSRINRLVCSSHVVDVNIDRRWLSSLTREDGHGEGNKRWLGRKFAGPTDAAVVNLKRPGRWCAYCITDRKSGHVTREIPHKLSIQPERHGGLCNVPAHQTGREHAGLAEKAKLQQAREGGHPVCTAQFKVVVQKRTDCGNHRLNCRARRKVKHSFGERRCWRQHEKYLLF